MKRQKADASLVKAADGAASSQSLKGIRLREEFPKLGYTNGCSVERNWSKLLAMTQCSVVLSVNETLLKWDRSDFTPEGFTRFRRPKMARRFAIHILGASKTERLICASYPKYVDHLVAHSYGWMAYDYDFYLWSNFRQIRRNVLR